MSFPKIILTTVVLLFVVIGVVGVVKKKNQRSFSSMEAVVTSPEKQAAIYEEKTRSYEEEKYSQPIIERPVIASSSLVDTGVSVDRIPQLFTTGSDRLPIVETVTYTSRVAWLKGRPAWITDYASYYNTSRHFIARSLNKQVDYFTQKVSPGDRFNVFRKDKDIEFYLLIDTTLCKMWFYYLDKDMGERVLLKTYKVGLGKTIPETSECATPVGKYKLGEKVAIFKSGVEGYFQEQKVEMIQVFGTRWMPFQNDADGAEAYGKNYGLQGAPWVLDPKTGQLVENRSTIGQYDTDGCVRLFKEDIEELYAILITKPTTIEVTTDYQQVQLPGTEIIPLTDGQN